MAFFRALAWGLYQILQLLLLLLSAPFYALRRGGRGLAHYLPTLRGRFAFGLGPSDGVERVWIHAVSVGEAGVAATLAARLPAHLPLVITTVTPTGQGHAQRLFAADAFAGRDVQVAYLPLDFTSTVERFRRRFRPTALILTEGDYWPLLLWRLHRDGLPMMVINGRSSDRAFGRQKNLGKINHLFYSPINLFAVQTEGDRSRLIRLGADASRVQVTGNLKYDTTPAQAKPEIEAKIQNLANERPILIAGSTMEGEDEQVLDAFRAAGGGAEALLVLVPRHPERWDRVARRLEQRGLAFRRRSLLEESSIEGRTDVLLLDSLGELAALYGIATAAVIGGTLVNTGGHNPLEAAVLGVPVAVGPSMHNFQVMADHFDRAGAWARVADAEALGQLWKSWLEQPEQARAVGQRAGDLLDANRGAVDRTLQQILPLLPRSGSPGSEP